MTREKALEALRVYCGWKYDTTIELWPQYSREQYLLISMNGIDRLDEELIIKLGTDCAKYMENPVGMLVAQLREMQNA
jgi:hypothetical protein